MYVCTYIQMYMYVHVVHTISVVAQDFVIITHLVLFEINNTDPIDCWLKCEFLKAKKVGLFTWVCLVVI